MITDDSTSTDGSTPKATVVQCINGASPEMVPSYGKIIKNFVDKKNKIGPGLWNKENGESVKEKVSLLNVDGILQSMMVKHLFSHITCRA